MQKSQMLRLAAGLTLGIAGAGALYAAWWPNHAQIASCENAVSERLKSPSTAKYSEAKVLSEAETPAKLQGMTDEIMKLREKLESSPSIDASAINDPSLHVQALTVSAQKETLRRELATQWSTMYDLHKASTEQPSSLVTMQVDSQNSMGAMVRSEATCLVNRKHESLHVEMTQR